MLSPLAVSKSAADRAAFHEALIKVTELNPKFAPAYIELARLWLRQNDPKLAYSYSRKAEELEPSRAGYHILTGYILLRMGKGAEAAAFAKYVAERWFGPDHDEAVELWNSIPAKDRPTDALEETIPKDTQTVSGTVRSVSCAEQEQGWAFILTHGDQSLTFHRKGPFAAGFSDTIWYGEDHFSLCHHLEGMRAVVRYRPPADSSYNGEVAEIEIRDEFPELLRASGSEEGVTSKP